MFVLPRKYPKDQTYTSYKDFINCIYERDYKKALNFLKNHFDDNKQFTETEKNEFKFLLETARLNDKTLLEVIYNDFSENCDIDNLKANNNLIQYMLKLDLLPKSTHIGVGLFVFIENRINRNRPDAGATLIPSFYRKDPGYNTTHYYQFLSRDHKKITKSLKSKNEVEISKSLYASCLLNIVRCTQELHIHYGSLSPSDKTSEQAKLIKDIILAIGDNLDGLVSFDSAERSLANQNICALLSDENIKKLSYVNEPKLARIAVDLCKLVASVITLGIFPIVWYLCHNDSGLDLLEPKRHQNFLTFFKSDSVASNIANEIHLSMGDLEEVRESCQILKNPVAQP